MGDILSYSPEISVWAALRACVTCNGPKPLLNRNGSIKVWRFLTLCLYLARLDVAIWR
jgi:hypothetical protein